MAHGFNSTIGLEMVRGSEAVESVEVAIEGTHDLVLEMRSLIRNPSQGDAEGGTPNASKTRRHQQQCRVLTR